MVLPLPLGANELPISSPFSVLEPFTYAPAVHVVPARVKKYAAPDSSAWFLCSRHGFSVTGCRNCWTVGARTPCSPPSSSGAATASVLPSPLSASLTPHEL